jgi:hypothetical protein
MMSHLAQRQECCHNGGDVEEEAKYEQQPLHIEAILGVKVRTALIGPGSGGGRGSRLNMGYCSLREQGAAEEEEAVRSSSTTVVSSIEHLR